LLKAAERVVPPIAEDHAGIGAVLSEFCKNLTDRRPLGIAVSGGSDSLGLLFGMAQVLPPTRLVALTVDHGLRDGSAEEARAVKWSCRRLGVRHETLLWQGEKPASGLQAKARAARYGLLSEAASRLGLAAIVTGHTSDDQTETLTMRRARGLRDGAPGLTGIPRASLFDGRVWVLRPLLGVDRASLRRYLLSAGMDWIEDPSNRDIRFERVRVRAGLAAKAATETFRDEASCPIAARIHMASQAAAFIGQACKIKTDGTIHVAMDRSFAGQARISAAQMAMHKMAALEALIGVCGGAARPLDRRGKSALQDFVSGRQAGSALAVGRTLLKRDGAGFALMRERRGLERLVIAPGQTVDWDGRYRITNLDRHSALGAVADGTGAALPSFSRDLGAGSRSWALTDGVCGGLVARRLVGGFSRVLPIYEFPLAQALARLAGGAAFPACPWAEPFAAAAEMV
jgi:tRNA(Ile)-lysidine synthase